MILARGGTGDDECDCSCNSNDWFWWPDCVSDDKDICGDGDVCGDIDICDDGDIAPDLDCIEIVGDGGATVINGCGICVAKHWDCEACKNCCGIVAHAVHEWTDWALVVGYVDNCVWWPVWLEEQSWFNAVSHVFRHIAKVDACDGGDTLRCFIILNDNIKSHSSCDNISDWDWHWCGWRYWYWDASAGLCGVWNVDDVWIPA